MEHTVNMSKIDFKKILKAYYLPGKKNVVAVDVPAMNYLMVDGSGAPDPKSNPAYVQAIEALYSVAYTIKFMIKRAPNGVDFGVMPMEGLWWADDMNDFIAGKQSNWQWTLMIMQPEPVTARHVEQAIDQVRVKKNLPALPLLRHATFEEGKSAQILHIGPFSEEGPTVEKVHAFIAANGKKFTGKHHEIYLSDLRRAAPDKLRTVIRQPMK